MTRWAILNKNSFLEKTLNKVCPTRWSSRHQAPDALCTGYFDVMKTLMYLTLNGKNKEELQAKALLEFFEDFSTVILIIVLGCCLVPLILFPEDCKVLKRI